MVLRKFNVYFSEYELAIVMQLLNYVNRWHDITVQFLLSIYIYNCTKMDNASYAKEQTARLIVIQFILLASYVLWFYPPANIN